MNQAFNDFLSSIGGGLSGDGGPNMKSYQHASKLYVEGGYARAPKFNHLYFVSFNISDGVVRDRSWLQNGYNTVGLLVKSTTLPKFKIAAEQMNQYNRKTQVQTRLTYEPVSMEFHDDNSEITNGLWKNYYRYYYTDSIYGGKDDTVVPTPSQVSLGKKLFGGLLSPGRKRIKQRENNTFPDAYTDNKYRKEVPYAYGLDNFQSVPFFKSIDIFVLHQQKFTQITLINPKIISWDHDDVGQSDSTKMMRNKMSLVYESVLYNDGRIGKGSRSGVFAEAFYDTSPIPLSIAGKGSASLFGPGGLIGGFEDVFGENGALAQGDYLAAALQAATLIKNAGQISEQQLSAEGYSMLGAAVGIAVSSRNGEIGQNLQNYFGNAIGVYTNQYSKNNLEDIPSSPVELDPEAVIRQQGEARQAEKEAERAQKLADERARAALDNLRQENQAIANKAANLAPIQATIDATDRALAENNAIAGRVTETKAAYSALIVSSEDLGNPAYLRQTTAYKAAIDAGLSDEGAYSTATENIKASNALAQSIVDQADKSLVDIAANKNQMEYARSVAKIEISTVNDYYNGLLSKTDAEATILKGRADLATQTLAYGEALNNGKPATSFESQIALDAKLSALTGIKILENSDLTAEQVKLESQASVAYRQYVSASQELKNRTDAYLTYLAADIAGNTTSVTDTYLFNQPSFRASTTEPLIPTLGDYIDNYGQEEGLKRYTEDRNKAMAIWTAERRQLEDNAVTALTEYNIASGKSALIGVKISANNTLVDATVKYNTNEAAARKLLESELVFNPNPTKPYVVITDSRTIAEIQDSQNTKVSTTQIYSSKIDESFARGAAIIRAKEDLAFQIYGDRKRYEEISFVNDPNIVTVNIGTDAKPVWRATVIGAEAVRPTPALETTVIVTYVSNGKKITDTPYTYTGISGTAAAQKRINELSGIPNYKVIGVVVTTKNTSVTSGKRYTANNS